MLEDRDNDIDKTGPKEVLWFIGLWGLGVACVLVLGTVIKLAIGT